ncbi:MAG: tetratricopeptide repeat protein [Paracoccaceae bacterium]|nr:tetratricopeptide repeat protein [Paracoccaceae bacterium]
MNAPDATAQDMLDRGMRARESYAFDEAERAFTELIVYCPNYAEGWNQRAFVHFLRQDFDEALPDLDKAIELDAGYVAAIAGKALTQIGLGEADAAQITLRQALALNPWLSERSLLTEPLGEEI